MSGYDDQQTGHNQMPSWAELTIETILEGQLVASEMAIAASNIAFMGGRSVAVLPGSASPLTCPER